MKSLNINNEECRSLEGFEKYHISESGRVYRTDLHKPRSLRDTDKVYLSENKVHYKIGEATLHYSNLYLRAKSLQNYKLSKKDVQYIRKYIRKKVPLNKIGKIFNVSEMQINRIKTGENWGNGKRKIKAPKAPFEIEDVKIRKYVAIFDRTKSAVGIKKPFKVKRNPDNPTDNLIIGILKGYKLTLKHTNITRANENVEKLNQYFFKTN